MATSAHDFARAIAWNPSDKHKQNGLLLYTQEDIEFYQTILGWEVELL